MPEVIHKTSIAPWWFWLGALEDEEEAMGIKLENKPDMQVGAKQKEKDDSRYSRT